MEEMVVFGRPRCRIPSSQGALHPQLTGDLPTRLPFLTRLEIERCWQLVSPLPRVPGIRELTTRSCDISQWKELPPLLQYLAIKDSGSLESLLEEGKLKICTCLQDLRIIDCSFSRTLSRVCLPVTLKSLVIHQSYNLDFLLLEFFKCHFPYLERLKISYSSCDSLSSFPLNMYPSVTPFIMETFTQDPSPTIGYSKVYSLAYS